MTVQGRSDRTRRSLLSTVILSSLFCCSSAFAFRPTAAIRSGSTLAMTNWDHWRHHEDASFHRFSDHQATEIRAALLDWYRKERRKLPWRGDPPPYDGSTAGRNTKASASSKKITNFFTTKANATDDSLPKAAAISVSGYGVWVSEIMLQQTRVEAVIPYWIKWMKSFPTVQELAAASEDQVNAHWAGLGFYRRARLLHQGAKHVVEELNGELPQTRQALLEISGIGPYTASAIASIAFDVCTPVVDGNVCRVLSRLTGIANHIKAPILKDKLGWELATQLVEAGGGKHAGEVNQALMELGATYCAPSGSGVDPRDPLRDFYLSTKLGRAYRDILLSGSVEKDCDPSQCKCELCNYPDGVSTVIQQLQATIHANGTDEDAALAGHACFPLDPPKTKKREEDLALAVIANTVAGETWWLLMKRPNQGLLAGQWEFPSSCVQIRKDSKSKPPGAKTLQKASALFLEGVLRGADADLLFSEGASRKKLKQSPLEHVFSHVKHFMWVESYFLATELETLEWETGEGREVRWMREVDMKQVGITSGVKKVLKAVKEQSQSISLSGTKKRKR